MARSTTQARRPKDASRVPAWVWLFTGAVLGAFIMFLMHLSENTSQNTSTPAKESTAEDRSSDSKPRFDFYELLKENQVVLPTPTTENETPGESAPAKPQQEFLLQVASFKSSQDAEALRASLILLNLEAYTEKAKIRNGETWHRVIVGPFNSKSKLAKARSILLSNRYEALVLKRQPQG